MRVFENKFLNVSCLVSIVFLFATVYVPFMQPVFKTITLRFDELGIAVLMAFIAMFGGELAKKMPGVRQKKEVKEVKEVRNDAI